MNFSWVTKYIIFMCAMFQFIGVACLAAGYLTKFNWLAFLMPGAVAAIWMAGEIIKNFIENKRG